MDKSRRLIFVLLLALLTLGIDQASKIWATAHLANQPPQTYAGVFTLTYSRNYGGWGSLGANWSPWARSAFFLVLPSLFLLGLVVHTITNARVNRWELAGAGMLVAGGAGNLIDRARFGYVQDFLYLGYGPIGTNIFNVADMAILVGIGLLLAGPYLKGKSSE
ncbi:MAG: signal peptidase II [Candidatus Eremiobacteraeota bacterium]|nr:signal peptidase II [Candidatus Eremiobacteraeota bacterium]MCW5872873.1 signal peptidase II [Candidatus Eremiobacteraeota bacterium]